MKQHFSVACGGQDVRISAAQEGVTAGLGTGIGCLDQLFAYWGRVVRCKTS